MCDRLTDLFDAAELDNNFEVAGDDMDADGVDNDDVKAKEESCEVAAE